MINLTFAELHTPLFLSKINWGLKLHTGRSTKGNLELFYDREHQELHVKGNDTLAIVPISNVVSMTPVEITKEAVDVTPKGVALKGRPPKAQASTPHDHVFAGQGAGKTND